MSLYSGEMVLETGDRYLSSDVKTARLWYTMALEDREYRTIALTKLINLERRIGRFARAREYINLLEEFNDKTYFNIGKLELDEHNYIKAIEYFSRSLSSSDTQIFDLECLANVYTQLGEFETARKMYETFINNMGFFGIINLDLIIGDYQHGLDTLKKIKINNPIV